MAYFKVSGKVPDEKDELIRWDIGFDKHFLKYLRILVGTLPGTAVLYVIVYLGCLQCLDMFRVIKENSLSWNFLSKFWNIWVFLGFY